MHARMHAEGFGGLISGRQYVTPRALERHRHIVLLYVEARNRNALLSIYKQITRSVWALASLSYIASGRSQSQLDLYSYLTRQCNQVIFRILVRKNLNSRGPLIFSHTSVCLTGFKIAIFAFDSSLLWWKNNINRGSCITVCMAHVPCGGPPLTETWPEFNSCNDLAG